MPYLYIALAVALAAGFTMASRPERPPAVASASTRLLPVGAILAPCFYFGAQVLAAPFFPHYSVLTTSASDLGSDLSAHPWILNGGALLTGVAAVLGCAGLALSLPRLGAGRWAAFAIALCLASAGLAAFWAGLHPLPRPDHNPGALAFGMFLAPFAALWAGWGMRPTAALRLALSLDALAFLALMALVSGHAHVDTGTWGGLLQKLLAFASFLPAALLALVALRRSARPALA